MRLVRLASSRSSGGLAIWVVVSWCAFLAGAGVNAARADTPVAADTTPAPADTTEAPATESVPLVAPIVVAVAQTINPSAPVTQAPGLVRSTALAGQPAVALRLRLSRAVVSGPPIAPAAAAEWPMAVVDGSRAPAGFWVAHGFGPAAQRSPVRVGGLESATASPRTRNPAGAPASQGPSEPGGTSGASTSSSVASGGSSSADGALSMILLAELGLATWGLYKLLISPAGWRSLTFISLLERPG
jgi:hypothetical protein